MFEWIKSREALHKIIDTNRVKAKKYGERMSILKSYDQSDVGMTQIQVNRELEKCNGKMIACERRIRRAEKYLV